MNEDSFAPPALRGELRGRGSAEAEEAVEAMEDGAGESRKPPARLSEAITPVIVLFWLCSLRMRTEHG